MISKIETVAVSFAEVSGRVKNWSDKRAFDDCADCLHRAATLGDVATLRRLVGLATPIFWRNEREAANAIRFDGPDEWSVHRNDELKLACVIGLERFFEFLPESH